MCHPDTPSVFKEQHLKSEILKVSKDYHSKSFFFVLDREECKNYT